MKTATTPSSTLNRVAASTAEKPSPVNAIATSWPRVITVPRPIPKASGSRVTASHTAAPAARSVAPRGCNAAKMIPAPPIAARTTSWTPRR